MLKARPTTYKGIPMRSRLEAAYAASLDREHQDWEYEPECFANEQGQYLPDFLIKCGWHPMDWTYVEVKPTLEAALNAHKRMEIIHATRPGVRLDVVWPIGDWPDVFFHRAASWPGPYEDALGGWMLIDPT
jgi:hypothetical protein